jgi:hypothetical protein
MMIARDYPRSQTIRSATSSTEAVLYSLDPLLASGRNTESGRKVLTLLAAYFSGRHSIKIYAGDLLSALNENRQLITDDIVKTLLGQLSRVSGVCTALALTVVKTRIVTGPECSSGLQLQIENYLHANRPV